MSAVIVFVSGHKTLDDDDDDTRLGLLFYFLMYKSTYK